MEVENYLITRVVHCICLNSHIPTIKMYIFCLCYMNLVPYYFVENYTDLLVDIYPL